MYTIVKQRLPYDWIIAAIDFTDAVLVQQHFSQPLLTKLYTHRVFLMLLGVLSARASAMIRHKPLKHI